MNLTLQTATVATSLFAAMLLQAGGLNPASFTDTRKASEAWTASLSAEQSGSYDDALKHTVSWRQSGGDLYLTLLRTAWLHYLKQDHTKAAGFYAQAAAQQPSAITPLLGLLATAQAMADPAKIQAAAERVLRLEPTNYKALTALAGTQFNTAEYRKSRSSYTRILALYPEDVDAMSGAAWSALYLGDKHTAQRDLQRLASISPDYPFLQDGLALCAR